MNEYVEHFQQFLRKNGLKLTEQRKLILDVFTGRQLQVTIEELFHEVVRIDPTTSLSTIYRTMKLLHKSGLAKFVSLNDGNARYEPIGDLRTYMVCEKCGTKILIDNPYLDCIHREVAKQQGFQMHQCQMTIYGLCPNCIWKQ